MKLILGTAQWMGTYGVLGSTGEVSRGAAPDAILEEARNQGFHAVDTAPMYGTAELSIGRSSIDFPVHTKLEPGLDPVQSLKNSMQRLGGRRVETLYFHEQLRMTQIHLNNLSRIFAWRGQGYDNLGASIYDEDEFELAMSRPEISAIQLPFNVLDRRFGDELLACARANGKEVIARSVFLQGLLAAPLADIPEYVGKIRDSVEDFQNLCASWGVAPLEGALWFALDQKYFSGIIVGARNVLELRGIGVALQKKVPEGFLKDLSHMAVPPWPITDPRVWTKK